MKEIYTLFYSYMSDKTYEYARFYANEEDALKALKDARNNKTIYGAYVYKAEINESYHNEMKD